jgi:type III secretion protein C
MDALFREISETYGLTWYFDGTTVHVYSLSELESRLLQVDPVDTPRIDRTLTEMRLKDSRYPLRVSAEEGHILVSGPPRYVQLVSEVVERVASAPSQLRADLEVRVFRLRHARAADTTVSIGGVDTRIPGIASILNEVVGDVRADPRVAARSSMRTVPSVKGKGYRSIGRETARPGEPEVAGKSVAPGSSQGREAGGASVGTALAAPGGALLTPLGALQPKGIPAQGASDSDQSQTPAVRAEPRINAVIVRDSPSRMSMYARLIEDLDVETPLLEIEASVIDISDDKSESLGVDWRMHGRRIDVVGSPSGLAGRGSQPEAQRNAANDLLFSNNPLSAGAGLVGTLIFGNERNYFLARVNALAEQGDARLISRPRVLTIDNTEAVLQSTREFYVRVAGRDEVDLFNVSLGLTMRVTPTVVDDGQGVRVKLVVRIEDGAIQGNASVDQIPLVSRNAISTQALVGDGQSLLIGGYRIEDKRNDSSEVPGLSKLPVLGWLFGQRGSSTQRVERMFMITPRLVNLRNVNDVALKPSLRLSGAESIAAATPLAATSTDASNAVPAAPDNSFVAPAANVIPASAVGPSAPSAAAVSETRATDTTRPAPLPPAATPASNGAVPPPVGSLPGYYINVGLFAEEATGRRAQARLLNEGLPAFRRELSTPEGRRIRVRVGPYPTRVLANKAAEKIRAMQLDAEIFRQ